MMISDDSVDPSETVDFEDFTDFSLSTGLVSGTVSMDSASVCDLGDPLRLGME